MGEKHASSSSSFLLALTTISTLLLISSTLFLLRSDTVVHSPVFKFLVVDHTISEYPEEDLTLSFPPLDFTIASPTLNHEELDKKPLPQQPLSTELRFSPEPEPEPGAASEVADEKDDNPSCNTNQPPLRVYMYDLPPLLHFGLLGWKDAPNQLWPNVSNPAEIPPYPGGLNSQHSVEYWLTLDLLLSTSQQNPTTTQQCRHAVRVLNSSEADAVFVPFFASLSYNRYSRHQRRHSKVTLNTMLQNQLVKYLMRKPEWRRSMGKDHIIVAHHPNSLFYARKQLASARLILADFGRYHRSIANLNKDIIAPYKHVVKSMDRATSTTFDERPILAYFQGAIYRKAGGAIRQELYHLLKDEKDVHFTFGSLAQRNGARQATLGMGSSKFCLNIAGDTPSSNRLFDAIVSHCVPVIISDKIALPFEDVLDYSEFSIFVLGSDAVRPGFLVTLLRGIQKDEWSRMWKRLKEVAHHFEYQFPSQPEDAVDMIWQAVARKFKAAGYPRNERKYRRPEETKREER